MASSGKHAPAMGSKMSESKKEVECGLCKPKYKARHPLASNIGIVLIVDALKTNKRALVLIGQGLN